MTAATVKMPRCSVAAPTEKYLLSEDLDPTREGFKCAKTECGEQFATTTGVHAMLLLFADNLDIQILVVRIDACFCALLQCLGESL